MTPESSVRQRLRLNRNFYRLLRVEVQANFDRVLADFADVGYELCENRQPETGGAASGALKST
jgi:hypothetical protein